jgi:metal-sulfur cluster biosynthetic enzyme
MNWGEYMNEIQDETQRTLESVPGIDEAAVDSDRKKKNIDEMIEEFKKKNPMKNQKKSYRGVF